MAGKEAELTILTSRYRKQIKEISETSKEILRTLKLHYTDDVLKTFKTQEDFLDDLNYICEEGGTGKLFFIKEIETKNIW